MGRQKSDTFRAAIVGALLGAAVCAASAPTAMAADCDIDMESGSWSSLTDLPIDRHENATAKLEIGGSEYIFFFAQRSSSVVVRYDITNDSWATSSDPGAAGAPPLKPHAFGPSGQLGDHKKALTIGNTIYIMGGTRPFDETVWAYDGINPPTQLSSIGCSGGSQSCSGQLRVGAFSTATLGGDIYIAGGHCNVTGTDSANCTCNGTVAGTSGDCAGNAGGPGENTDRAFRYDPAGDDWTAIADLPIAVDHGSGAALGGKFYVFGGRQCGTDTACEGRTHTQIYNPGTNSWSFGAAMPEGCSGMGHAAIVNDRIYVIGGEGGTCTKRAVQEYDPVADSWRMVTSLPDSHHGMTPIVVGDPDDGIPDRILLGSGQPSSSTRHMHEFQFSCEPCGAGCQSCSTNGDCDDGDFCNGSETCDGDTCEAGSDPCPGQACDESGDTCVECVTNVDCDDGDACNGDETCSGGTCSSGSAPNCDDGSPCTSDMCDESAGCVNVPLDCSDANACTIDSCNESTGACEYAPTPCADPDNDGLEDADDPCPSDPRNLCFGSVAVDAATGNDIRLNANVSAEECSGDKTDCNGDLWHADYAYNLAAKASSCNLNGGGEACVISGITDLFGCDDETTEDIFQCEHSDNASAPELIYDFDVPNGQYLVNIFFASTFDGSLGIGDRVTDLIIEGVTEYDDFDQVAAGGNARAIVRSAVVSVSDGNGLQVEFGHVLGNPAFKALEVLQGGDCVLDADCDDGAFCNGSETCDSGTCMSGSAPNCSDGVACTIDSCNEGTDSCDSATSNAACDDGAFCNGVETCHATLGCQAGSAPNCSDGVACTIDSCNEASDSCDSLTNSAACDDGAFCNGVETCHATLGCQAGSAPNCSDGVGCTVDTCNEAGDSCDHATSDAACDDGAFCNGTESCHATLDCQSGTPPTISDSVACTNDFCDEANDRIVNDPLDTNCDDGAFCNGAETCDAALGCLQGKGPDCDDSISCTTDACNESLDACTHTTDDNVCDDGAFCNGLETCSAGGGCQPGTPPTVDDGVGCTDDVCDEMSDAVTHSPRNALCDDQLFCNGNETCDVAEDCVAGTPPAIDDGIACTVDSCNEMNDQITHLASNELCSDGAFCNGDETCSATSGCIAGIAPCTDGVACTTDGCDETSDECLFAPSDAQCDDGSVCNGAERCDSTLGCQASSPVTCTEEDTQCATHVCDEQTGGCLATPLNEGGSCEDGNLCTLDDTCVGGSCLRTSYCGVPISRGLRPTATDALFALRTSVGLEQCSLCECDVNTSGTTTVADALAMLSSSVGIEVSFDCFLPIQGAQ